MEMGVFGCAPQSMYCVPSPWPFAPCFGWYIERMTDSLCATWAVCGNSDVNCIPGTVVEIGPVRAAMLGDDVGLRVERVHLRHAALLEDHQHTLRGGVVAGQRALRFERQQLRQRQAEDAGGRALQ